MKKTRLTQHWLGIIADANAMTLYAVDGTPPKLSLAGWKAFSFDRSALGPNQIPPELRDFIETYNLNHAPTYVALEGTGAVVHTLRMPKLSERERAKAIRTRLSAYAGTADLCIDYRTEGTEGTATRVVAAGVEAKFARNLRGMLEKVGLRVERIVPLASTCSAPKGVARGIRVVLGERSTAIQVFEDGHLVLCREVLFGRSDVVAAYRRPILAESGPVTLTQQQAELLAREVGVPLGKSQTPIDYVQADQLWPLIAPVLQKFQGELERTLQQQWKGNTDDVALDVLSVPNVPGLSEYLAIELHLQESYAAEGASVPLLAAVHGSGQGDRALDLEPPEDRFARRMQRPAMAAAIAAFLIILANLGMPQQVEAKRSKLEPTAELLEQKLTEVNAQVLGARTYRNLMQKRIERDLQLATAAPTRSPLIAVSRALFATVPAGTRLVSMNVSAEKLPVEVELLADYRGPRAPGHVVAEWTRALQREPCCAQAEVTRVSGDGQQEVAKISIRVVLR